MKRRRALFIIIMILVIGLGAVAYWFLLKRDDGFLSQRPGREQISSMALAFQLNKGQFDEQVKYAIRNGGQSIFFTPTQVAYTFIDKQKSALAIKQTFVGTSDGVSLEGINPLAGKMNYFIGNDSSKWQTDVATYAAVVYKDLYPGVDLQYSGEKGDLLYTFTLQPGSLPSSIKLALAGVKQLSVNANGELMMETALGTIGIHKPVAYQQRGDKQIPVDATYAIIDASSYGFAIGTYDRTLPLTITTVH